MTKEEAKEYVDNYLSQIIVMVEYGNWFSQQIKDLVNDCIDDCNAILEDQKICNTKQQSAVCKKAIDLRLEECSEEIASFVSSQVNSVADEEKDWLDENVASPLKIKFNYPEKAKSLMMNIPIATAGIVGLYGVTVSSRLKDLYNRKIMASYVTGSDFEELEDDYEAQFESFERGLENESGTLGSSLAEQYDRIVYTANARKIKGYVWQSLYDSHTCLACGEMSGQKFDDITKVPVYPLHLNCRCSLIPFTENIEDVIPESYEEWFESQPKSEKYKILGKTRFQLYENGMKIKKFVNNGHVTPLNKLKK